MILGQIGFFGKVGVRQGLLGRKRDFEPSCIEGKWVKGKWARERFFWVEFGLK